MHLVRGSQSTNTVVAPAIQIASAVAKKVFGWVITSSPGPIPRAIRASQIAPLAPVRVRWANGAITHVDTAPAAAARDLWIAPALIDLQINGFAGIDFQRDGLSADRLQRAVAGLRTAGCSQFLLTLVTDR